MQHLEFHIAAIPLIVAAIISASLSVYALYRRNIPHAVPFALVALGVTIWTLGYALRINTNSMAEKMLWQRVLYLGNATTPVFFLIFALGRAHHHRLLTWQAQALYMLPAVITIAAVLTNDSHHLMWRELWIDIDLRNSPGPIYWFNVAYSNLYTIASIIVLVQAYYKSSPLFRSQAAIIALAAIIPLSVSIVTDVIGWDVVPNFDEPTFSLLFTNLILAWAIFDFKVLDIVPIAHSLVIQNMQDGIMVVDTHDRIVYFNSAMQSVLDLSESRMLDYPASQVLGNWAGPSNTNWDQINGKRTVTVARAGATQHYEVHAIQLSDRRQRDLGHLMIFHDVTEQKVMEQQLQSLATTDPLTHCYNRRYFLEQSNLELERARRFQRPLSILMLDIDHFKDVNDTHGHPAGDRVLQEIVLLCQQNIRIIDLLARFGGEEFIILLPETESGAAMKLAERIRRVIEGTPIATASGEVSITVSIGVTGRKDEENTSLSRLIERVDQALYASKNAGRNQVSGWQGEA